MDINLEAGEFILFSFTFVLETLSLVFQVVVDAQENEFEPLTFLPPLQVVGLQGCTQVSWE